MSSITTATERPARSALAVPAVAAGYAATGYLVVMAWAVVGAWPMTLLFGLPLIAAGLLAAHRPQLAAAVAVLPCAAVAVWWVAYVALTGLRLEAPWTGLWFVAAGATPRHPLVTVEVQAGSSSRSVRRSVAIRT